MEFQFPSIPILFISLFFILFLRRIAKRSKPTSPNLPPGPWKLPLIGNMHQLAGPLPHHTLRDLAKKHGPIMHLRLGEVHTIVVSSPQIVREIMKTHDLIFAQRPFLLAASILGYNSTNIGFSPYGSYWRQLRKICIMELLSPKRVRSFRSIREDEVSNLVTSISANLGLPINLTEKIASLMYAITARAAFGEKVEGQEEFRTAMKDSLDLAGGFSVVDMFPSVKLLHVISPFRAQLVKVHEIADRILENIINLHRESKATMNASDGEVEEDLVDILLRLQEHGNLEFPLTTDNIKAVIMDIYAAGSDTSSVTIDWTMVEMLKNPKVLKKAQAEVRWVFDAKENVDEANTHELEYLKLVIKETLRLHPPGPLLLPRESRDKCKINGYDIPSKTKSSLTHGQ